MKATAEPIESAPSAQRGCVAVYSDLFKARLTFLVVLTTVVGFFVGTRGPIQPILLTLTLVGTAMVAAGAAALNQYIEREHDTRMRRTATRPLPAKELSPGHVLLLGAATSLIGLGILQFSVNSLTALLGAATLLSYLFVYTPLKRLTTLNTIIGAIPGALPPLMGWAAARNDITLGGWSLFAILFLWQLPHFLAIAWLYREDYAQAGYVMLPVVDPDGARTGSQAVSHSLLLIPVSLAPFSLKLVGPVYLFGALAAGIGMLVMAWKFSRSLSATSARRLFFASIIYLPLILALMVLDKS